MTNPVSAVDHVVALLVSLGWTREEDLVVQGRADRPVFRRRAWKAVVGPLWTTYYRLIGECIYDQDSMRTEVFEPLEEKIRSLSK